MIVCYTGKPGSGKTSICVYDVYKDAKRTKRKVYTNMSTLKYPDVEVEYIDVKDIAKVKNGIILLDEANYVFNSRFWYKIDANVIRMWQMHRKRGVDIYLTSHTMKRLDSILRELVQYERRVKNIFGIRVVIDKDLDDESQLVTIRMGWRKSWRWFDTLEEIE